MYYVALCICVLCTCVRYLFVRGDVAARLSPPSHVLFRTRAPPLAGRMLYRIRRMVRARMLHSRYKHIRRGFRGWAKERAGWTETTMMFPVQFHTAYSGMEIYENCHCCLVLVEDTLLHRVQYGILRKILF